MVEAIHCAACAKGDDGGILGNAFTCALDGIDRPAHSDCAHGVDGFMEDMRPIEQRYPLYDPKIFTRGVAYQLARVREAIAKGERPAVASAGITFAPTPGIPLTTPEATCP